MTLTIDERVARLSAVSVQQLIEPDVDVPGALSGNQVLPDELLSVAGLGLDLTPEQRLVLAREETASIIDSGVRFEAALMAGFSLALVQWPDLTDPRVTYLLHEVGEETRHSRLFIRLLEQLSPTAVNPLRGRLPRLVERVVLPRILSRELLLFTLVLTGEEIPDLFQRLASEHPETDPFLRDVSRYHRREEARHLAFARMMVPEAWARAGWVDRALLRHVVPAVARGMFDTIVHPGVYAAAGLPAWPTWNAVRRDARRLEIRTRAFRPIVEALVAAGALRTDRMPRGWRRLSGLGS
jgi:hypothetical protein